MHDDEILTEPCVFCKKETDITSVECTNCGRSQIQSRKLWTWEARKTMYFLLRKRFKNPTHWDAANTKTRKEAMTALLPTVSKELGWTPTIGAIEDQIRWVLRSAELAIVGAKDIPINERQTPTFIHNLSAAHAAGFIGNKELNITLRCSWNNKR